MCTCHLPRTGEKGRGQAAPPPSASILADTERNFPGWKGEKKSPDKTWGKVSLNNLRRLSPTTVSFFWLGCAPIWCQSSNTSQESIKLKFKHFFSQHVTSKKRKVQTFLHVVAVAKGKHMDMEGKGGGGGGGGRTTSRFMDSALASSAAPTLELREHERGEDGGMDAPAHPPKNNSMFLGGGGRGGAREPFLL